MKVAIFQGFNFHHEMIGYALDYCRARKYPVNLYTRESDWLHLYKNVFGQIPYKKIEDFDPVNYDVIFLLTDNDPAFQEGWVEKHGHKVVCIDHYLDIRRNGAIRAHVATRPFAKNMRPWALPCFHMLTYEYKHHITQQPINLDQPRLVVTCLGTCGVPKELRVLKEIFADNFEEIEFNIISRSLPHYTDSYSNVHLHQSIGTMELAAILERTTHILCFHKERLTVPHADHYEDRGMGGCVPIAFDFMCQLIIPDTWQCEYEFTSAISYGLGEKIALDFEEYQYSLGRIVDERERLVQHRNVVFDDALKVMKSRHLRSKLHTKLSVSQQDRARKQKKGSKEEKAALIPEQNAVWQ